MTYDFTFDILACVKERPRFNSITKKTYTAQKTRVYENTIAMLARRQMYGRVKLQGCLFASVAFEFQKPKKTKLRSPRGDLDNLCKSFFDSINDIVYEDDNQIIAMGATKAWGEKNKITLWVQEDEKELK